MKNLILSVITITRDDTSGLARTLASCARFRANRDVEQLVIDGGEGTSVAVAATPPVRHIERQPLGIADAFNTGLAATTGEWVWFLNGGDEVDERLSIEVLLTIARHSKADVIIGGTTYQGEADPRPFPPPKMLWPPFRSWIPHPSTLIRRSLFARFGDFDVRYKIAMDYEWWIRALSADVPVDLVSLPFARFSLGGVSMQTVESCRLQAEMRHALWRHKRIVLRSWLGQTKRVFRDLTMATIRSRVLR